jgi:hypothetical protein
MSGDDLAVTRRIPQDRRSIQESYDEVARSMVNLAEDRYHERDDETAEWLLQWAHTLTEGRVGDKVRPEASQNAAGIHSAAVTPPAGTMERVPLTLQTEDYSRGLTIEWPIASFSSTPPAAFDTPPRMDEGVQASSESQPPDELVEAFQEQQPQGEAPVNGVRQTSSESFDSLDDHSLATRGGSTPHFFPVSELVRYQPVPRPAGTEVALHTASIDAAANQPVASVSPGVWRSDTTLVALGCFAGGVVCCFVLHACLLLTPVRLTIRRADEAVPRTPGSLPEPAPPERPAVDTERPAPRVGNSNTPLRAAQSEDDGNAMIEQFYSSNVELFEQFAQTAS